jgi:hypothetical protein
MHELHEARFQDKSTNEFQIGHKHSSLVYRMFECIVIKEFKIDRILYDMILGRTRLLKKIGMKDMMVY